MYEYLLVIFAYDGKHDVNHRCQTDPGNGTDGYGVKIVRSGRIVRCGDSFGVWNHGENTTKLYDEATMQWQSPAALSGETFGNTGTDAKSLKLHTSAIASAIRDPYRTLRKHTL